MLITGKLIHSKDDLGSHVVIIALLAQIVVGEIDGVVTVTDDGCAVASVTCVATVDEVLGIRLGDLDLGP